MTEAERAAKNGEAGRDEAGPASVPQNKAGGLAQADAARREERNQRLVTQERIFGAGVVPFYPGVGEAERD